MIHPLASYLTAYLLACLSNYSGVPHNLGTQEGFPLNDYGDKKERHSEEHGRCLGYCALRRLDELVTIVQ